MNTTTIASWLFSTNLNVPGVRTCVGCQARCDVQERIDTENDQGVTESYCQGCYWTAAMTNYKDKQELPRAVSMSSIEAGGDDPDESVEFGKDDRGLIEAGSEMTLIYVLKALPKDTYRVIALMLFLNQMGFAFRYEDIATIWGYTDKEVVGNKIKRIQTALRKAGVSEKGLAPR